MRAMLPWLLAVYAVAVAAGGTWWLPRASWPRRAPRLGIAVWQAFTVTVLASATLAGLILAIPCLRVWDDWTSLGDCVRSVRAQYASPGGAVASTAGGMLVVALAGRLAWSVGCAVGTTRRRRARHDEVLSVVGRRGPVPGMVLLEDDRPVVYCVPVRRRVVFTTGALRRLDRPQLDAVLAHERAHLAARHHLVIILATALRGAFPRIPFFAAAASQIGCLVEMAADDAAARRSHRLTLARALLTLAAAQVPAGALGAGDTAAAQRIRRLIESPRPASRARRAATSVLGLIAAPMVAFSVPALALMALSDCPADAAYSHLDSGTQQPVPASQH